MHLGGCFTDGESVDTVDGGSSEGTGDSGPASTSGPADDAPISTDEATSSDGAPSTDASTDASTVGSSSAGDGICGDGIVDSDEACDLGAGNDDTGDCKTDCTTATCGDGFVHARGEACDGDGQGGAGPTAACDDDCTPAMCGDGNANPVAGEDCDDEGESATCNFDCTLAFCGDSLTNVSAGEACDDGIDGDDADGCTDFCQVSGYLPCSAAYTCGAEQVCIATQGPNSDTMCAEVNCTGSDDCLPNPWGTAAVPICSDLNTSGTAECGLGCALDADCPDGMICNDFADVCLWEG